MAKAGDELGNPFTGQTLTFRLTTADTGGDLLEVESTWAGPGPEPPEHHHPSQQERFEVLEGTLQARVGDEQRLLEAGDILEVPAGMPHSMWNPGPGQTRARWQTRPALRTEAFFETAWGLAQRAHAGDSPNPDESAAMLRDYADVFRLGRPGSP